MSDGTPGNDVLRRTPGDDRLYGGDGDDLLIGDELPGSETGTGDDILQGDAGNDMILGGLSRAAGRLTGTVLRPILPLAAALAALGLAALAPAAADTTAPTISSVTLSSTPSFDADGDSTADTYIRGDRIVVDVRFSEAVTVSGGNNGVRLRLDLGADDTNLANSRRVLMLKSVVGGNTLRFEHRVQRRDSDPDGVWVQTLTATNARTVFTVGGAVTSTATGVAAVLTTSGLPTSGAANHKVDGSRTQAPAAANRAPTFPAIPEGTPLTLYLVTENNAAGAPVVTVAATDPDGDALSYALDSASDAVFDIDSSGNVTVTAANALDHETKANYAITVSVHDGKDATGAVDTTVDATRSVRIVVADAEEPPVFPANAPTTLEVAENNAAGAPVGRVSATDSDGDALTYALDSASDAVFDIDANGNVTVTAANALDYETKASYAVTVSVHDGKDAFGEPDTTVDATHSVTITVTDVKEPTSGPPTIASVTISSAPSFDADGDNTADTYVRGDRIVVDVRFSEAVSVSGGNNGVRLRLDLGADDTNLANSRRVLKLKSVVGGNTLRFEHGVQRRDSDPDGVWVQTLTATNARTVFTVGGAVTSTATGVAAVLTTSGLPTSGAANHKVDGSRTPAQPGAGRCPGTVGERRDGGTGAWHVAHVHEGYPGRERPHKLHGAGRRRAPGDQRSRLGRQQGGPGARRAGAVGRDGHSGLREAGVRRATARHGRDRHRELRPRVGDQHGSRCPRGSRSVHPHGSWGLVDVYQFGVGSSHTARRRDRERGGGTGHAAGRAPMENGGVARPRRSHGRAGARSARLPFRHETHDA